MRHKFPLIMLTGFILASVHLAHAQQPKKSPRIGRLSPISASAGLPIEEAFRQGLRDLGWIEGQNIVIEYRYAEGKAARLPELAAELVRLRVDLIVAGSTPGILAAKNATGAIPVVMVTTGDPVVNGLVASLARPGGNVTGLTALSQELSGKRLELLKEAVPSGARVAVLSDPAVPDSGPALKGAKAAARALGVRLQELEVRDPNEFEKAFVAMARERAGALMVLGGIIFNAHRERIVELTAKSRLPAIYDLREYVEAGGLMFYGATLPDMYRRAATYVDKILKGAKPANLPVEQPIKFEFVINLKTAKQIGLTISPNVLVRADKVIKESAGINR
jgi:ABC-type uncharacterized transport system substrate-binding protein